MCDNSSNLQNDASTAVRQVCAITVVMWFASTAVRQVCAITVVMWFSSTDVR